MLAAYGAAAADEAGTYFMAHTFDGRRALLSWRSDMDVRFWHAALGRLFNDQVTWHMASPLPSGETA